MGMFTRLIFRNPFQVARAAISSLYRRGGRHLLLCAGAPPPAPVAPRSFARRVGCGGFPLSQRSNFITFVVFAEIQAGSKEVDVVRGDLVAQQAARGAVML